MPFSVEVHDFQPLDNFEFIWRWTDSESVAASQNMLSQIHVLSNSKAQELDSYLHPYCKKLSQYIFQVLREKTTFEEFSSITIYNIQGKLIENTRNWLKELEVPQDSKMLVSWNATTAVLVPWSVLCQYWDDFYYPGQDDLCIGSISEKYYLIFYHEGNFVFGIGSPTDK